MSLNLLEKERKVRKSIRRKKGKSSKLPTIYENAVYFDSE